MNRIIEQLSQIEEKASGILSEAANSRRRLTAQYEEKTRAFDEEINAEAEKTLAQLKKGLESQMAEQLRAQKDQADQAVLRLEEHYNARRENYVNQLFKEMTEV